MNTKLSMLVLLLMFSCKVSEKTKGPKDCFYKAINKSDIVEGDYYSEFLQNEHVLSFDYSNNSLILLFSVFEFDSDESSSIVSILLFDPLKISKIINIDYKGNTKSIKDLSNKELAQVKVNLELIRKKELKYLNRDCQVEGGVEETLMIKQFESKQIDYLVTSLDETSDVYDNHGVMPAINNLLEVLINYSPR